MTPPPRVRVLVAGAARLDDLMDRVVTEVAASLPDEMAALRIGSTSLAPRDEAARAARWVSRLAAGRGVQARLARPGSTPVELADPGGWRGRGRVPPRWSASPGADAGGPGLVSVGVSRLDLSPDVAVVVQPYAVGVWLPLEDRVRRLRRSVTAEPDVHAIDAALRAQPVVTLVVGLDPGLALALVGADLLAVEVVARSLRTATQPVGDLGLSPWEAPVVQRGIERAAGVVHPDLIDLASAWLGDPRHPGHDRLHRIVDLASARAGITARL